MRIFFKIVSIFHKLLFQVLLCFHIYKCQKLDRRITESSNPRIIRKFFSGVFADLLNTASQWSLGYKKCKSKEIINTILVWVLYSLMKCHNNLWIFLSNFKNAHSEIRWYHYDLNLPFNYKSPQIFQYYVGNILVPYDIKDIYIRIFSNLLASSVYSNSLLIPSQPH